MDTSHNSEPLFDFRLFEATPGINVIVCADSPVFTILAVSNDFIDLTALKRHDIVGKSYFTLFTKGNDNPRLSGEHNLRASFDYMIKNKTSHEIPVQRFDVPGENGSEMVKYWKFRNAPLLNTSGDVTHIIHAAFDVTDKVIDHKAESPDIHKAYNFFMNAPVIIGYVRGEKYIIEFANDGLLKVWNKSRDIVGKSLLNVFPELEQQGVKQLLDSVRTTGKPFFAYEHPLTFSRDGESETLYFDFVYQPYYEDPSQKIASGVISVGHDVTEQIKARQLQRSIEELRYANQNLEEFAYAASHDLKEPVRKILFFSNKLKEDLKDKLNESQLALFNRLEKSSGRMQNLIDDLLEYSQASTEESNLEEIDLELKIKNVLEDLEVEIQKKHAKIYYQNLPRVRGNKRQLQQLFQNLLSNALKYSRQDVNPEISIVSRDAYPEEISERLGHHANRRPFHLIAISDNGIGFDQKDADKVFKVFTRLHATSQYAGTGIGLAIVRKVVEAHNGVIWAESEQGKGSTFKILWPA